MQAIVLTTNSSFYVNSDVPSCVQGWGGDLIIKSGTATSNVTGVGLGYVQGSVVSCPWVASAETAAPAWPVPRQVHQLRCEHVRDLPDV